MKNLILVVTLCLLGFVNDAFAQMDVVDWSVNTDLISENEALVIFTATIDDGWKLYSQHTEEGGPLPTQIQFEGIIGLELVGEITESDNVKKDFSDLFEINVTSFKDKATFTQKVKLSDTSNVMLAKIRYMACDGLKCIPPTTEEFKVEF